MKLHQQSECKPHVFNEQVPPAGARCVKCFKKAIDVLLGESLEEFELLSPEQCEKVKADANAWIDSLEWQK